MLRLIGSTGPFEATIRATTAGYARLVHGRGRFNDVDEMTVAFADGSYKALLLKQYNPSLRVGAAVQVVSAILDGINSQVE